MTDLVKKQNEALELAGRNPLQTFRDLFRWDPFREMAPFFRAAPTFERMEFAPRFEVTEQKDAYVFKADVPGVKREELEISVTGNRLQIAGKRDAEKETKTETVYTYEREFGSFLRTFTLPDGADLEHAKSELKDGVLTLAIPKLPTAQTKKIAVSTSSAKS